MLSLLMTLGASVLGFPGGVVLICCAWCFHGWPRRALFMWAELIRGIPLIFVIFWLWFSTLASQGALPDGQYDAALSGGFSSVQTLRLVLLPQVLRNALPSYLGLLVALLKDTLLAFIGNVPELTTVAGQVNNRVQVYPAALFIFTGAVYYLLCSTLEYAVKRHQRRYSLPAH
ncbi:amino acid ABC transporter membrane protein 2, PAAT family [Kosakonia arachidis]|uniref:Amino acid ABC transporter membrane protein 2, PAAT family n=1 Tax=Kosakonia arachidis TaxID=551989 RepID=A0A1I6Z9J7_9ENTR|nr:amino acid ABC transporter membrane protein 2, PAAT family [Kosakonia arachidis]